MVKSSSLVIDSNSNIKGDYFNLWSLVSYFNVTGIVEVSIQENCAVLIPGSLQNTLITNGYLSSNWRHGQHCFYQSCLRLVIVELISTEPITLHCAIPQLGHSPEVAVHTSIFDVGRDNMVIFTLYQATIIHLVHKKRTVLAIEMLTK